MACKRCKSERVAKVTAKCSDLCFISVSNREHDGYVPRDLGIGGGDYVEFTYCLDCGQIAGKFPLGKSIIEEGEE